MLVNEEWQQEIRSRVTCSAHSLLWKDFLGASVNSLVGDRDVEKSIVFTRVELPLTVRTQMVAKVS